ncbi:MAG: DUF378 domain-containing protein [Deltaproteobacteria bacterium]|nr:DUF378 domain-containing protein [Deltaproteobacteria bacterium]
MKRLSGLSVVLLALVIIGAINWGLVGLFNWNLVAAIFGGAVHTDASVISRIIYVLVGVSGLALLGWLPRLGEHPIERRSEVRP